MRNITSCICILGLAGFAYGDVLLDQIGDNDGSGIGENIMASQDFEAGFDTYDIVVADDFTGDGGNVSMVEMVLNGWNGFTDPSTVNSYTSNLYSSEAAAGASLTGDIASHSVDAADVASSPDWAGAGFVMVINTELASAVGSQYLGVLPQNDFATGGQTGIADSLSGDGGAIQANPAGGFGFGPWQAADDAAYRVTGGAPADPCSLPLPAICNADIDGEPGVAVGDILAVIATWGEVGDGTSRPLGDCAPMPNGDCMVNVADVLEVIGQWGADCAVYGGCCYGDGSCAVASSDACAADGGTYFGDNTDCSAGSCVAGACCLNATDCVENTADACGALGGSYKGDGTACATTDCAAIADGDEAANAIVMSEGANAFDSTNCTQSPEAHECAADAAVFGWTDPTPDIWLSFTATNSAGYAINTCDATSFDTSIIVYEGGVQIDCNGDALDSTGCQPYSSELNIDMTAGSTYLFRIGGYAATDFGAGTLNINEIPPPSAGACCFPDESCLDNLNSDECSAFGGSFAGSDTACADDVCAAGAGDECADAVAATEGATPFDTSLMTASQPQPDESMCAGTFLEWGDSPDAWFVFTPASNGNADFSLCDAASYDTSLVLYEGSCDTQIACNGDATDETGCQAYYSGIYAVPVTAGTPYYVRIGGWQGASGAGTLTITFVGGDTDGACCLPDGSCTDATSSACASLGGSWGAALCADTTCPQPWTGCPAGSESQCDQCWVDGDDSIADCNGGANSVPEAYQDYYLGDTMCGTGSVFVDASGGTYRDLDWYVNDTINAGGDFNMSFGTSGMGGFCYIYDPASGAVIMGVDIAEGGGVSSASGTVPAGTYVVLVAPDSWNTAWTCDSGLGDYHFTID